MLGRLPPLVRAVAVAIGTFALGFLIYNDIVEAEESGGTISMNVILIAAYDIAGKWGVVATWTVISAICVGMSYHWNPKDD